MVVFWTSHLFITMLVDWLRPIYCYKALTKGAIRRVSEQSGTMVPKTANLFDTTLTTRLLASSLRSQSWIRSHVTLVLCAR